MRASAGESRRDLGRVVVSDSVLSEVRDTSPCTLNDVAEAVIEPGSCPFAAVSLGGHCQGDMTTKIVSKAEVDS